MKKIFGIAICFILMFNFITLACAASIGTATTSVYARDPETGEIKGSLKKNDNVIVEKVNKNGWADIEINGSKYKVWANYLEIKEESVDDVEILTSLRRSKTVEKGIKNKTSAKLTRDSDLYNLGSTLWG